MRRQPPEAAKGDSPEAIAALDAAFDLVQAIGRRVRAEQAREAAVTAAATTTDVASDATPTSPAPGAG